MQAANLLALRSLAKDVTFNEATHLAGKIANPRLWSAETPNLYQLEVRLKVRRCRSAHSASEVRIPHH